MDGHLLGSKSPNLTNGPDDGQRTRRMGPQRSCAGDAIASGHAGWLTAWNIGHWSNLTLIHFSPGSPNAE
jgi:hypothetical protein